MTIYRTTRMADAVLANIEWFINDEIEYVLEPYQNGREHGWSLRNRKTETQVAFSESRNSDSLVLYTGEPMDFEMAGNVPSDAVYAKKEFFSFDKLTEAAKRIIQYLE